MKYTKANLLFVLFVALLHIPVRAEPNAELTSIIRSLTRAGIGAKAASDSFAHATYDVMSDVLLDAMLSEQISPVEDLIDTSSQMSAIHPSDILQDDLLSLDIIPAMQTVESGIEELSSLGLLEENISPELAMAETTRRRFLDAKIHAPEIYQPRFDVLSGMPIEPIYTYIHSTLRALDLYPEETAQGYFGSMDDLMGKIMRNHNLWYTYTATKHIPAIRQMISAYSKELHQEIQHWANFQPEDPFVLAAEQVPADVDTLYFSEFHLDWVPKRIVPMLDILLKKNPGREVFVLMEFYSKGHVLKFSEEHELLENSVWPQERYYPLLKALEDRNIPVIGLEPDFVSGTLENEALETDCTLYCSNAPNTTIWETLEGIRIRNQHWLEVYNKIRAEHPDALIIVYAGSGHLSLLAPFSLPREIPGKNFVIEIKSGHRKSIFEYLISPTQLPNYIKWSDPKLAEVTGSHIRIQFDEPEGKEE